MLFFSWRSRWWWALAGAVFLLAAQLTQPLASQARVRHRLVARADLDGIPPEYILTNALLGGFRTVFIQVLWQRAQEMKQENKYYEMVDIYNVITKLQPGHHMAWAFQAWDLSYNVSVEFQNLDNRVFWVFRGLDLLRFQGIPKNNSIPELPFELSWIFHHKIGASLDFAHPYYRANLANQVAGAMMGDFSAEDQSELLRRIARIPAGQGEFRNHPRVAAVFDRLRATGVPDPFELGPGFTDASPDEAIDWLRKRAKHLAANPSARAELAEFLGRNPNAASTVSDGPVLDAQAARTVLADPEVRGVLGQLRYWFIADAIRRITGFDPAKMNEIVAVFGDIDWRAPYAHSLYWAVMARDIWWTRPDKEPDLKFERLIYFSLIQLTENGRVIRSPDGFVHYLPDYRLIDAVVAHMNQLQERYRDWKDKEGASVSLVGMMSAYTYFLRDAIFLSFYDGRERQAARLLDQLIMILWQRDLDKFIANRLLTPEQVQWVKNADLNHIAELRRLLPIEPRYYGTIDEVMKANLGEFLDSPGPDKANALVVSWLSNAYWSLALGDIDRYQRQSLLAQSFYQNYSLVRWPQDKNDVRNEVDNRHYIAPIETLRLGVLVNMFSGRSGFWLTPVLENLLAGGLSQYEPQMLERLVNHLSQYEPQVLERLRNQLMPEGPSPDAESAP